MIRTVPRHEKQRRQDLRVYLRTIRRQAIYGARIADGQWPEVHQHLMAIVAQADDAVEALNGAKPSDLARFAHDDALQKAE